MKRILPFLFLAVATSSALSANPFEGSYEVTVDTGGNNLTSTVYIKGSDLRFEMDMGGMTNVMLMKDGMSTMTVIMPAQKMYMEMPVPMNLAIREGKEEGDLPPFEKTGREKEIEGFKAHEYLLKQGKETMTIWATDALGSLAAMNTPMMMGVARYLKQVTGLQAFFPLEMSSERANGETFRMNISNIERKELDGALFVPPADFRKMNIPTGMGAPMGR
jgi:hypothetical protein